MTFAQAQRDERMDPGAERQRQLEREEYEHQCRRMDELLAQGRSVLDGEVSMPLVRVGGRKATAALIALERMLVDLRDRGLLSMEAYYLVLGGIAIGKWRDEFNKLINESVKL